MIITTRLKVLVSENIIKEFMKTSVLRLYNVKHTFLLIVQCSNDNFLIFRPILKPIFKTKYFNSPFFQFFGELTYLKMITQGSNDYLPIFFSGNFKNVHSLLIKPANAIKIIGKSTNQIIGTADNQSGIHQINSINYTKTIILTKAISRMAHSPEFVACSITCLMLI